VAGDDLHEVTVISDGKRNWFFYKGQNIIIANDVGSDSNEEESKMY